MLDHMTTSDFLGIVVFGGFGLWWLFFPRSVAKFSDWFYRRKMKMPKPYVIRIIGATWFVFVVVLAVTVRRK